MDNLVLLVKMSSAMYHAWRLKDDDIIKELTALVDEIPRTKNSLVSEDKKVERKLRDFIYWLAEQPKDSNIITSLLNSKVAEILLISPELERVFENAYDVMDSVQDTKQLIFQIIKEIKDIESKFKFNFKLKSLLRPFMFEGESDLSEADYAKLSDLLNEKLATIKGNVDRAVMEEAGIDEKDKMVEILKQYSVELSAEGILKSGLQGLNQALWPDMGFRRSLFYIIEALTNRGKSFFLAHLLASFVLYNKPVLRDKTKIPCIFFCSAEDSMGLVLRRMYEIFETVRTGVRPDFFEKEPEEVINTIIETFNKNGWAFKFYRVDPTHDNIREFKQRTRNLEMEGYEIIVGAYDYLGLMGLDGTYGDTRSDRLQNLITQTRNFLIARGAIGITPWQLNPKAKELLRENDDESEINFVREVGGHSMTEGTTKATNETDVSITAHMAKLMNGETFFCGYVGKVRGEGAPLNERFFFYPIEQGGKGVYGRGLIHDINFEKSTFRRSMQFKSEAEGGGAELDALL